MFKKDNRLTKDKEFDNVFKTGRSSYDKNIGIKAVINNLGGSRIGILISTKVSKKAVERNKIRRRIREILKLRLNKIKKNCDLVLIVLPAAKEKTYQELEESIDFNLKRLRLV
ncbi:MAG: ribonuclease P protein component [Patescibacteria group bacterium]|nr:ribonuclease P protein component [Patescibacteria group bacterium]MDD4610692.1 ribonuclease P protein component [Patescibacteria group bacterium]